MHTPIRSMITWMLAPACAGSQWQRWSSSGSSVPMIIDVKTIAHRLVEMAIADGDIAVNAPEAPPSCDLDLPIGWEMIIDGAGQPYFFNTATGDSQWEKPGDGGGSMVELTVDRKVVRTGSVRFA